MVASYDVVINAYPREVIGAQVGTVYLDILNKKGTFKEVRSYDSIADLMRDVALKRIKAGFGDQPIIAFQFSQGANPQVRLAKDGLGIAYSSYQVENFRAGIEAVDAGQREAAQSIGMRMPLVMRRVILPQAFRITLPPYGNTLVMMLKDSSLVSTIPVAEMTRAGQLIASA